MGRWLAAGEGGGVGWGGVGRNPLKFLCGFGPKFTEISGLSQNSEISVDLGPNSQKFWTFTRMIIIIIKKK